MKKDVITMDTFHYKIGQLEKAIVELRMVVSHPQEYQQTFFTPMQYAMLLEAARIGYAEMIRSPQIVSQRVNGYPFP